MREVKVIFSKDAKTKTQKQAGKNSSMVHIFLTYSDIYFDKNP